MTTFPRPTRLGFDLQVHEIEPGRTGLVVEAEEWLVTCAPLDHTIPALGYRFQEKDRPGRFDGGLADSLGVPFGPERGKLQRGESITLPDGRVVRPEELIGPPRPGKSVCYVTDTGFAISARRLALETDLLIHEATYGDDALKLR